MTPRHDHATERRPSGRLGRAIPLLPIAVIATAGCLGTASAVTEPLPAGGHHVLFIGNSLTSTHDLPATVAAIAESAGDTIRVRTVAGPNLALIDHLNGATNAESAIRQGGWEYVVLQQGPTPAGICRDSLVLWTKMFDPLIRGAGATPALFMTWPSASQQGLFDAVRISFEEAARTVDGVFLPAGEAWRLARAADPSLALWGGDGFHPSPIGTFLAALEIYERVSGRDVRTIPAQAFAGGDPFTLPVATIRLLQEAAHAANQAFPAHAAARPPGTQSTAAPAAARTSTQC